MPLLDVTILGIAIILIGGFCVYSWHPAARRPRKVKGLDPQTVGRLGVSLAKWLVRTHELVAVLELFREHTVAMLAHEREAPGGYRQMRDVNYLIEIRKARSAGQAWLDEAAALPDAERRTLADHEIDPSVLRDLLGFPWGLSIEHDRKPDRSDEVEDILHALGEAMPRITAIGRRLESIGGSPYR